MATTGVGVPEMGAERAAWRAALLGTENKAGNCVDTAGCETGEDTEDEFRFGVTARG
jgi:hypothetical protein